MQNTDKEASVLHSSTDIEVDTGIRQPSKPIHNQAAVCLQSFEKVLGANNISADPNKNQHYRKGWRSGEGSALAVLFPQDLLQLWEVLKIAVKQKLIVIMQAANTGLTEGSTPSGNDYDRPVIVINTLALDDIVLLNKGKQVLSFPGATLHKLEETLSKVNRSPHSVIGSSTLGATVVGGIANNSGGALVKRGPAYTELSVFAKINEHGQLLLVNHLGIKLGDDADTIIKNLATRNFPTDDIEQGNRSASDTLYQARIKNIDADTPSRFNADPRRLYEASGCAGKLAVFAVRVDSHPVNRVEKSFYIGTNDANDLYQLRRQLLSQLNGLPEVGEYMHRDIFDIAEKYGKDTFLSVLHLGTKRLPNLFAKKGRVDALLNKVKWLPPYLSDRIMQHLSRLFPSHIPERMKAYRKEYEHHLVLKLSNEDIEKGHNILTAYFANSNSGNFFECDQDEAKKAYLHRFAAAGAAIRYQTMHNKEVGSILALDIALKRNEINWVESFPPDIEKHIEKKLYYGHFFCYVFHQDYILKKGVNAHDVKKMMLTQLDKRGAKYPAEHNVGYLYKAEDPLKQFYTSLDPTNTFNPGIGKLEKTQRNCQCCL
ncbi:D-lactate dehydrogenase [Glaciecola petra]|uniref:Quinone-dependent D-lactate dehydrogenase n=1 Tax=Glaciecola petra TaxID=3075602 RepID=A0ABU2ZNT9_9ALTE|nr:D-lactate dehydrogenase [Aestuariibacter sp. P117]MDT0594065.1 D-lactate dehydrogenase [Aestuariibacter sp. P117]